MNSETKKLIKIVDTWINNNDSANIILNKLISLAKKGAIRNLNIILLNAFNSNNVCNLSDSITKIADVAHHQFLNHNMKTYSNMVDSLDRIRNMKNQPKFLHLVFNDDKAVINTVSMKNALDIIKDAEIAVNRIDSKN